MSDKKENLISEIPKDNIKELFENGKISNGKSGQILKSLGYYKGLADLLRCDISRGISSNDKSDLEWRMKIGSNEPKIREPKGLIYFIIESMEDKMLQILIVASLISLLIGVCKEGLARGWIEGFAIFLAVFIVVTISSFNNWSKEQQFQKLYMENKNKDVTVRRDGIQQKINIKDILVGDVLKVEIGDIVPVDGILVEGQLLMDESNMNGESHPVTKKRDFVLDESKTTPFVVSGTSVKEGGGYILVCLVGEDTQTGIAGDLLMSDEEETPLQTKLGVLADKIGELGLYAAIVIGLVIIIKEIFSRIYFERVLFDTSLLDTVINAFVIAVVVIVVAIPEGLPMAVTISLAYSVMKMKEKKNLVRHMDAAETMGGVDCICSDKTGTLTEGIMTIREIFIEGKRVMESDFPKCISESIESIKLQNQSKERQLNPKIFKENSDLLFYCLTNNCEAVSKMENGKMIATGNMTDVALLQFFLDKNIQTKIYKEDDPVSGKKCLPFNSEYKLMATIKKRKNNTYRMYFKGAPERFLENGIITKYVNADGEKVFDADVLEEFKKTQEALAEQTMRTLLILYKDISEEEMSSLSDPSYTVWKPLIKNLTIVAMLGIADKPRLSVKTSIKELKDHSGIFVRMVTGDNIRTAIAISKEIGIIDAKEAFQALKIVKLKEERDKRLNELNKELERIKQEKQDFPNLASNLKGEEAIIKQNELDKKIKEIDQKIQEEKFCLRDGHSIEMDPYIALEGPEFQMLSGGIKKSEEEVNQNKDVKLDVSDEEKAEKKKTNKFQLSNQEQFKQITKNLKIIARASPDHKFTLVVGLKIIGSVVAVTGDGTNDAPALRAADVGFAMGIRGTDIAKDASDIVLLNDSFDSITTAVLYGRNVFDCIRKFLQFQLTCNVVAVFMTLLGGIVLNDSPLNAIQMLWVNLIMDSFASLALATEEPKDELLHRKPYGRTDSMITKMMMFNIVTQSIFQIVVLSIIIFYGDEFFGVPSDRDLPHSVWNDVNGYHFTIFFNIFVYLQVFNSVNARKLKKDEVNVFVGIFDNYLYLLIQFLIIFGQVIMVSFGGRAVRTHYLSFEQHVWCMIVACLSIPLSFAVKFIPFDDDETEKTEITYQTNKSSIRKSLRGDKIRSLSSTVHKFNKQ